MGRLRQKRPSCLKAAMSHYKQLDKKYAKSDNPRMAWLAQTASFDPDPYPAEVLGLAASLGNHDSGQHAHQRVDSMLYARGASGLRWRTACACCRRRARPGYPGGTAHRR